MNGDAFLSDERVEVEERLRVFKTPVIFNVSIERFPHKPYINVDFPKNVTAVMNSTVTFKCPIVSDLEPFIQWVKVVEYPGDQENSPNGTLLQVPRPVIALGGGGVPLCPELVS